MDLIQQLSRELHLRQPQVEAAVRLLDEGNTIPFIARYRKEMTDSLDDAALRDLSDRLEYLRGLQKRREEKRWPRWRTCTAPISPNAVPAAASPGKRDWSRWQPPSGRKIRPVSRFPWRRGTSMPKRA